MPAVAQLWYRNFDSCGPVAGQSLPACCVVERTQRAQGLRVAVISPSIQAAYHGAVAATLAKVATSGEINSVDPHMPEDLQPTLRLALLADVAVQWHLQVGKAYPHMPLVASPTGAFFLVNNHQELSFLLGALHVCGAKPLSFRAGPKRAVGMEATVQQLESPTLPVLSIWLWKAHLFGVFQTDPRNNCAT